MLLINGLDYVEAIDVSACQLWRDPEMCPCMRVLSQISVQISSHLNRGLLDYMPQQHGLVDDYVRFGKTYCCYLQSETHFYPGDGRSMFLRKLVAMHQSVLKRNRHQPTYRRKVKVYLSTAQPIHHLGTRCRRIIGFTLRLLYPGEITRVHIE